MPLLYLTNQWQQDDDPHRRLTYLGPNSHVDSIQVEPGLAPAEFIDLLHRSSLAERRPVGEPSTIAGMLANADIIVTARTESGLLIGVSRAITDYHWASYLSDLAVDQDFQRQGIGRELISRTHQAAGLATRLILLVAPASRGYYPRIGMCAHDSCWMIEPQHVAPPGKPPAR